MDILKEEKNLWKKGFKNITGLDEAGRGPLAGPVTACAVLLPKKFKIPDNLKKIKDSKKLTPEKREEFCMILKSNKQIKWGTANVSEKMIDKINIFEASKLAMLKAVDNLEKKINGKIDFLILDGNFKINSKLPQKPIIKADDKIFSVMAASVIAKVTRDKLMAKLDRKYPKYKFAVHKGYPTELHQKLLKKYGACKIHRKTFGPVLCILNKKKNH
jgi:ribonuclease HII